MVDLSVKSGTDEYFSTLHALGPQGIAHRSARLAAVELRMVQASACSFVAQAGEAPRLRLIFQASR